MPPMGLGESKSKTSVSVETKSDPPESETAGQEGDCSAVQTTDEAVTKETDQRSKAEKDEEKTTTNKQNLTECVLQTDVTIDDESAKEGGDAVERMTKGIVEVMKLDANQSSDNIKLGDNKSSDGVITSEEITEDEANERERGMTSAENSNQLKNKSGRLNETYDSKFQDAIRIEKGQADPPKIEEDKQDATTVSEEENRETKSSKEMSHVTKNGEEMLHETKTSKEMFHETKTISSVLQPNEEMCLADEASLLEASNIDESNISKSTEEHQSVTSSDEHFSSSDDK